MQSSKKPRSTEATFVLLALACQAGCGDPSGASAFSGSVTDRDASIQMSAVDNAADADAGADGEATSVSPEPTSTTPAAAAAGSRGTTPIKDMGAAGKSAVMTPARPATTSYHRDIRPVLASACVSCHVAGGSAALALDSWDAVHAAGGAVADSVASGRMPPWPADDDCHGLIGARALPDKTRALFSKWADESFPEGNAKDYAAQPSATAVVMPPPTLTLDAGRPYTPLADNDGYRCFVTDYVFDKDTYISALDILPDQLGEVHDVQVHSITPDQRIQLQTLDLLTKDAGYTCDLGLTATQTMFGWQPGSSRLQFDQGDGAYIAAGSSILLQVHYNTQFLPAGAAPTPDQSKVKLWTLPQGELPERVVYRQSVLVPLSLPKDDPYTLVQSSVPFSLIATVGPTGQYIPGEVIGMSPHAHQLATQVSASLIPESGIGEQCLLNVPDWQPGWQLDYLFKDAIPYAPNDNMRAVCIYDNTPQHQPMVNGVQQQSKRVALGEAPGDEMCLHHVWLRMDRRAFLGQVSAGSVGEVPVTPAPTTPVFPSSSL